MLNYANNKNAFIRKESNDRFGFKVASEILRHDQHTAIPGGRIREIRFFGLRTLTTIEGYFITCTVLEVHQNYHGYVVKVSVKNCATYGDLRTSD